METMEQAFDIQRDSNSSFVTGLSRTTCSDAEACSFISCGSCSGSLIATSQAFDIQLDGNSSFVTGLSCTTYSNADSCSLASCVSGSGSRLTISSTTTDETAKRMKHIKRGIKLQRKLSKKFGQDFTNLSEARSYIERHRSDQVLTFERVVDQMNAAKGGEYQKAMEMEGNMEKSMGGGGRRRPAFAGGREYQKSRRA